MTDAETLALRALRDCRVIRAAGSDPAFAGLRRLGLAFTEPVAGTDKRDFRLSSMGWAHAGKLPSLYHHGKSSL